MSQWQPQAYSYLLESDYAKAIRIYEEVINDEPEVITHYFYLGLLQLLVGEEAEAQFTWMAGFTDQDPEQIDVSELVKILSIEIQRQQANSNYETAWLICQHIHEIEPKNLDNLLTLVLLSIQLQILDPENTILLELIEGLVVAGMSADQTGFNHDLMWELLSGLLKLRHPLLVQFTESCLPFVKDSNSFILELIEPSLQIGYSTSNSDLAISLLKLCLRLVPEHLEVLEHIAGIHLITGDYAQGLETAKLCSLLAKSTIEQFYPNFLILQSLFGKGGNGQAEVLQLFATHESLLLSLIAEQSTELSQLSVARLRNANYFTSYIRDEPRRNRFLQNQISQLCQLNTKVDLESQMRRFRDRHSSQKLKIGYISSCMRTHSVGWLARWLINYHDHQQFQLYGYFCLYNQEPDQLRSWYESQMDQVYRAGIDGSGDCEAMADRIYQDQIDILIDLDSITLDITCGVMALKPAPIQVTWLGSDASGIPTIDYFIADPYVLPDYAQEYYAEKIWRLPQTYIAVDGFEVDVPTLRRDQLNIPADAVIYLSTQNAFKRHPDNLRLQMQIIKSVPNSYFLIKGFGDQDSVNDLFMQTAIAEGINPDRLRFLPKTPTEAIHRANLGIADVILDTYPYNGATTTLETLWMCIPLVTRVGEQFAARNSYTMMINAGISEGIAWSDTEYVEWGVRLGQDPALRQNIATRLKASRQTSPLWNGEKFTREMENAYKQMWEIYSQSKCLDDRNPNKVLFSTSSSATIEI